jgi:hypothetical protein
MRTALDDEDFLRGFEGRESGSTDTGTIALTSDCEGVALNVDAALPVRAQGGFTGRIEDGESRAVSAFLLPSTACRGPGD